MSDKDDEASKGAGNGNRRGKRPCGRQKSTGGLIQREQSGRAKRKRRVRTGNKERKDDGQDAAENVRKGMNEFSNIEWWQ